MDVWEVRKPCSGSVAHELCQWWIEAPGEILIATVGNKENAQRIVDLHNENLKGQNPKIISIIAEDAVIHNITGIPKGVEVHVFDIDMEGAACQDAVLHKNPDGVMSTLNVWKGDE